MLFFLQLTNLEKINELQPRVRWAGLRFCYDCLDQKLDFRILEAYRTPARQKELYAQGRTKPGPIVTYTLSSKHTDGLAIDIQPINCTHKDLEKIAFKYGITHPLGFDPPHWEFDKVGEEPPSLQDQLRLAERAQERLKGTRRGMVLDRLISRLRSILGV